MHLDISIVSTLIRQMAQLSRRLEDIRGPDIVYVVVADLVSASQLVAPAGGSSDPYCQLAIGGTIKKSEVQIGTSQPIWNQRFRFYLDSLKDSLKLKCLSWDSNGKHTSLGETSVSLEGLLEESLKGQGAELEVVKTLRKVKSGKVVLKVRAWEMTPFATQEALRESETRVHNIVAMLEEQGKLVVDIERSLFETKTEIRNTARQDAEKQGNLKHLLGEMKQCEEYITGIRKELDDQTEAIAGLGLVDVNPEVQQPDEAVEDSKGSFIAAFVTPKSTLRRRQKCCAPKCKKTSSYQCPLCKASGEDKKKSGYCSQDCFQKDWINHKQIHQ